MSEKLKTILERRLNTYKPKNDQQVINAAKEVIQELALLALSRNDFFKTAAFHGGTALRLFYNLSRFSEDLDFCLLVANKDYSFSKVLVALTEELSYWGLKVEIVDKTKLPNNVKKAMIKESSISAQLLLTTPLPKNQKLLVKVELDINPPDGARTETKLCQFPTDFYVTVHDKSTLFAGKIHALLCRSYVKGRDWYDLGFYIREKTPINFTCLKNALLQVGPYVGKVLPLELTKEWVCGELSKVARQADFVKIRQEVLPFLENHSEVDIWSNKFFEEKIRSLGLHFAIDL